MPKREGPLLPAPWDDLTLQSLMDRAAQTSPARIFMRDCPAREAWNGMEPRTLNHDALFKGATFLAAQLRTLGIEPGEQVMLLLPNMVEVPLSVLACHLAGAVPAIAPIDEKLDVLRAAAERCSASMILTTGRVGDLAIGDKARQIAAKLIAIRCVAGFGFNLPEGIVSLEGWSEEDVIPLPEIERHQSETGLVTFARDESGAICAIERSEGQMIAEALALSSVMRLDGRRGLISVMQPGAAASFAASLTLPLHAGASVRLVGPYDSDLLGRVIAEEPTAFLFCPDHFAAALRPASFGADALRNQAGILALARAPRPDAAIIPAGALNASLVVDFGERGIMTSVNWPRDGRLALPARFEHPMESVLPEGEALLEFAPDGTTGGFGAARLIRREQGAPGKAA